MSRIESNVASQIPEQLESSQSSQQSQSASQKQNAVCSFESQRSFDTGYSIDNSNAKPTAQGSALEQMKQAAGLTAWTQVAGEKALGVPIDGVVARLLTEVKPTPPDNSKPTEYVNYASTIKGVSAKDAFEYFKKHPTEWFGAAGITLHPPVKELKDGARVGLTEPGITPPVMAPIEVHIDEASRTVSITTLDGHPLRGVNQFSFEENATGDCEMRQSSAFQLSSFASEQGSAAMSKLAKAGMPGVQDAIERQHQIWERAHANVADQAPRK